MALVARWVTFQHRTSDCSSKVLLLLAVGGQLRSPGDRRWVRVDEQQCDLFLLRMVPITCAEALHMTRKHPIKAPVSPF